jgi:hypothetical protein
MLNQLTEDSTIGRDEQGAILAALAEVAKLRAALETIVRNEELQPDWRCVGVLNVARAALAESQPAEKK